MKSTEETSVAVAPVRAGGDTGRAGRRHGSRAGTRRSPGTSNAEVEVQKHTCAVRRLATVLAVRAILVTAVVVLALYFPCRWFAAVKAEKRSRWVS